MTLAIYLRYETKITSENQQMRIVHCSGVLVALVLSACKPEAPEQITTQNSLPEGDFMVSQQEFNNLSAEDQYMIANKILSPMMRGVPVDDFFDTTNGLSTPQVKQRDFINSTLAQLSSPMEQDQINQFNDTIFGYDLTDDSGNPVVDEEGIPVRVRAKHRLDSDGEPQQVMAARMFEYPISKTQFDIWMAYFLANTIMFSPAREMESTDTNDVIMVTEFLEERLSNDAPIRDIIRAWLPRESRWRVSRSPENHALEMFELYLGKFNDTPKDIQDTHNGGQACKEFYLTDDSDDYRLRSNQYNRNTEPVLVLNSYIISCSDLYDLVANHHLVIPRVTEVLVNYFLDGQYESTRLRLIGDIVAQNPTTFREIFISILFSEEYLLRTPRAIPFDEKSMSMLSKLRWNAQADSGHIRRDAIPRIFSSRSNNFRVRDTLNMSQMTYAPMTYKIGRQPSLPLDVLSFASYHKAMRERVLDSRDSWAGHRNPSNSDEETTPYVVQDGAFYVAGQENLKPALENFTPEDLVHFVFLTALGRKATTDSITFQFTNSEDQVETITVNGEVGFMLREGEQRGYLTENNGELEIRKAERNNELYEYWTDDFAELMFDYISRLPEFYYHRTVQ